MKKLLMLILTATALPVMADEFDAWDQNHDGKLSSGEVPPGPRMFFGRADTDKDGFLSRAETAELLSRRPVHVAQQSVALPGGIEVLRDLNYAGTQDRKQTLDLVLPIDRAGKKLPLIVFIHGGAWMAGDKKSGMNNVMPFVRGSNYIGASVEYRFSQEAKWPAQIFDCKAAIRWLRGNAALYSIDPDKIAVWGGSAGGHLVAMMGTSGGVKELEGELGAFTNESSRVQAVVDFFGPSDFAAITNFPSTIKHGDADSPEAKLIGGRIADLPEVAKQVSPVTFASSDDPPFLIAHGTKDMTVPFNQSDLMKKALLDAKVAVPPVLIPMTDAGHGFHSAELDKRITQFFDLHLRGIKSEISSEAIKP